MFGCIPMCWLDTFEYRKFSRSWLSTNIWSKFIDKYKYDKNVWLDWIKNGSRSAIYDYVWWILLCTYKYMEAYYKICDMVHKVHKVHTNYITLVFTRLNKVQHKYLTCINFFKKFLILNMYIVHCTLYFLICTITIII